MNKRNYRLNGWVEDVLLGGQNTELVTVGLSADNSTLMRLALLGVALILFNHSLSKSK